MKKLLCVVLASAFLPCLSSCKSEQMSSEIATPEPSVSSFNLDEYKSEASAYRQDVYQASIILGNIANYESKFLTAAYNFGDHPDADNVAENAFEWLSENSNESRDTVSSAYDDIRTSYRSLILSDFGDDPEAAEIDGYVRSLYEYYSGLYELVTEPTLLHSEFASEAADLLSGIQSTNEDMLIFLPESE